MRGVPIAVLAAAAIVACGGSPDMEVRTYELDHMEPEQAEALLEPYVRAEGGGVFSAVGSARAITVRETPETLEEIERVLAEHDRASHGVALEFAVLEAGTFDGGGDDALGLDSLLRDVLKFEEYRTVARAVVRASEKSAIQQNLGFGRSDGGYLIEGFVGRVTREDVQLAIVLHPSDGGRLLETTVTVPLGQTVVLGTAVESDPGSATILTVRPILFETTAPPAP